MALSVVIIDDHPICREAARIALGMVDPVAEARLAGSVAEARPLLADAGLVTLDLGLPDARGVTGLAELLVDHPDLPILVISGAEQPGIEWRVAETGARGFVPKTSPFTDIATAMRAVLAGETWFSPDLAPPPATAPNDAATRIASLTAAQRRILEAMRDGKLNKQIAYDLGLSEITVKTHVKAILRKLVVVNRTQAVLLLREIAG